MSSTNPQNITTEWDDLQVQYGNFAPPPEQIKEADLTKMVMDFAEQKDYLEDLSLKQLDRLEDDVDEDKLAYYRRKRVEEMKKAKEAYKFGTVYEISKAEYSTAVTESSSENWVLCLLYSPKQKNSQLLMKHWPEVARRFGEVKFVQGEVSGILDKFPETSCPTVLLYHKKKCFKQLMGLEAWGGEAVSPDSIEWRLSRFGIVTTDMEVDPTKDDYDLNRRRAKGAKYSAKELYGGGNAMNAFSSDEESTDRSISDEDDRDDRGYVSNQIKGRRERFR